MGKADAIGCGQTNVEFVYFPQVPRDKRTISQQKTDVLGSDVDPNKRWSSHQRCNNECYFFPTL